MPLPSPIGRRDTRKELTWRDVKQNLHDCGLLHDREARDGRDEDSGLLQLESQTLSGARAKRSVASRGVQGPCRAVVTMHRLAERRRARECQDRRSNSGRANGGREACLQYIRDLLSEVLRVARSDGCILKVVEGWLRPGEPEL